ncbi:Hpt domain-containing protein [Halarcobacter bivalviorum]|uniref:HPt domain-containing protein n=1 Tax=Halarcobacter bivalviorum TaxID=663364 RepID=A0AAX2A7U4_9BACT|nr:Hpt domain-containing protein [Halarcobacter bivalviorum]AXH13401.1 hypothetical protein ABIV_2427 [Halarcobacter bivalviorum]RXK09999.1 hypothetical protein CRV05_06360 [Halarcobacter bivalviorum]
MNLKYINKDLALKYLDYDIKLYKNILEGFKEQYTNLNFLKLEDNSFYKEVHQLKSLSKNIGANQLYKLAEDMNKNKHRELETELQEILANVLSEIERVSIQEITTTNILNTNEESKEELFAQILNGAIKNRPKKVEEPIEKLKTLKNLTEEEKILIEKLDKEIKVYNFKNIVNILS